MGLGKCVHCEEKSFGRQEVIHQYPKFVLGPHHAGLNIFKSSFENIFDQIESFLGLSTKVENSAKEFLLLISDGWNSVVCDIKGSVCGFPTADGEVAYILKVNKLAESTFQAKKNGGKSA